MIRIFSKNSLLVILRNILGLIFAYAAWAKFESPQLLIVTVVRLQLVPFSFAEWVGSVVPVAEMITAIWLLSGWRLRAASLAVMCLSAMFIFAVGQAMIRGLDFDCHCFGVTKIPLPREWVLIRAILLLGFGVLMRIRAPKNIHG